MPPKTRLEFRNARTGAVLETIPVVADCALRDFDQRECVRDRGHQSRISRIESFPISESHYSCASRGGSGETIRSVTFSKDGHFLIGRGGAGYVVVWSRATAAVVRQFTVPGVFSVAVLRSSFRRTDSPCARIEERVVLADLESGRPMCTLPFPHHVVEVRTLGIYLGWSDNLGQHCDREGSRWHLPLADGKNVLCGPVS